MSKNKNYLVCKRVKYYCFKDEDAFFWWLDRIKCVVHSEFIGDSLYLELADRPLHDDELDDLIGFFYRYKIDMKQLAQFLTSENKEWFYDNKIAFWHRRVFGTAKKSLKTFKI